MGANVNGWGVGVKRGSNHAIRNHVAPRRLAWVCIFSGNLSKSESSFARWTGEGACPYVKLNGASSVGTQALSNPHRHYDVAVLVVFAFFGAELACGLGIFEFQAHLVGASGLEEVEQIRGIEAHGDQVAVVSGFE